MTKTLLFSPRQIHLMYEFFMPVFFILTVIYSYKIWGKWKTIREFTFGFYLTWAAETVAVIYGAYLYPDWLIYLPPFPKWTPIGVPFAWAGMVFCIMTITNVIFKKYQNNFFKIAFADGAIALGIDLVLDPVVANEPIRQWVWYEAGMKAYKVTFLNIPILNFIAWFLLIFFFSSQIRYIESKDWSDWKKFGLIFLLVPIDLAILAILLFIPI